MGYPFFIYIIPSLFTSTAKFLKMAFGLAGVPEPGSTRIDCQPGGRLNIETFFS